MIAAIHPIQQVYAHYIGNKTNSETLRLSETPLNVTDEKLQELLRTYFLSNFSAPEYYSFTFSNEDFTLNPLFQFAKEMFSSPETFHENTINMARHLYDVTQHPNIKSGELYVAFFESIDVGNITADAIGIFKSENKENFLKLTPEFTLHADAGINVKKLDKGCLILNTEEDEGYKILLVDNLNKSDAQFWIDDFLKVKAQSDAYHFTQTFMSMARNYVADEIDEEFSVSKADKIDLLNRSVEYFKSKEHFHQAEFEKEVLNDVSVIESFRNYSKDFIQNSGFDVIDHFEISASAVKRQARIFKSVLKLDKNFHIYIHGNRELIEKGYDEVMGKHYYKLYFESES